MTSVFWRELKQYFLTPTGYVFTGIFWLLGAAFFFLYNVLAASSDLSALFGNMSYLFMMIVPLLTMRLLSEERRSRTVQLLYCAPTSLARVVLGKFLAACAVLLVALAGTFLYVAVIGRYARVYAGFVFSNYLGFFLLCACYIAVGLLMSAVTQSQITAAVLTFGANMLLQLLEMIAPTLHVPYLPFLPDLLGALSLNARYADFKGGMIKPASVAYYAGFVAVALGLTVYLMDRRRWSGKGAA